MGRYVVNWKGSGLYLVTERSWDAGKSCVRSVWVEGIESAQTFLSEPDAWKMAALSGCGRSDRYEVTGK